MLAAPPDDLVDPLLASRRCVLVAGEARREHEVAQSERRTAIPEAELVDVQHCVAVCNGTVGLEIASRALGLTGEVIVPAFIKSKANGRPDVNHRMIVQPKKLVASMATITPRMIASAKTRGLSVNSLRAAAVSLYYLLDYLRRLVANRMIAPGALPISVFEISDLKRQFQI